MWRWILGALIIFIPIFWIGLNYTTLLLGIIIISISLLIHAFKLEKLLLFALLVFLPISIEFAPDFLNGSKIGLPSESVIVILSFTTIFRYLSNPKPLFLLLKTSVFYAILFFLVTMTFTSFFSEMPEVSVKFTIINSLYVITGFGLGFHLFAIREISIKDLVIPLFVGFIVLFGQFYFNIFSFGVSRQNAHILPKPFFNDHTIFGATLALLLPLLIYFVVSTKRGIKKYVFVGFTLVYIVCIYLSFSRATWLSVLIMLLIFIFIKLKLNWTHLVVLITFIGTLVFMNWQTIENAFYANNSNSNSKDSSLLEQVQSVTNITSDVSNEERINRWKCALRMGNDKPIYGYGPGTYQFKYFPYQRKNEMTMISVNSIYNIKQGHGGTAHSEYLLSFSESGYLGIISWIFLICAIISTFVKSYYRSFKGNKSAIALVCFLGLITFLIHAFFNNFLNSANFGIYFWLLLGILAIDSIAFQDSIISEDSNKLT